MARFWCYVITGSSCPLRVRIHVVPHVVTLFFCLFENLWKILKWRLLSDDKIVYIFDVSCGNILGISSSVNDCEINDAGVSESESGTSDNDVNVGDRGREY